MAEHDLKSSANSIPSLEQVLSEIIPDPTDTAKLPPVHLWNPERCSDIGMSIDRQGRWWHEGGEIKRAKLVRLFSTILRREDDGQHYLVTPYEKVVVHVADVPFLAVRIDQATEREDEKALVFRTNVGDVVVAGPEHELRVENDPETLEPRPYLHVRERLFARLTRPVFYELAGLAVANPEDGGLSMGVWSRGRFFVIGPAAA